MNPHFRPLALCLTLAIAQTAMAAPVYEQKPIAGSNVGYTWTSQFNSASSGWQTHDNFTLGADASISRVTWRGVYLAAGGTDGAPNTSNWTIEFRTDDGGTPGALAFSKTFDSGAVYRSNVAGGGYFGANPVEVYDFDLALGSAFAADAGTQYWFSVRSNADAFLPLFGWTMGDPWTGAETSYQTSFSNGSATGNYADRAGNRAFALYDVPEPQALGLAGLALLAAFGRRRQRAV